MVKGLANVYLKVNNLNIAYVPGSLVFNDGRGTRVVRTQSLGGGASEVVWTDNVETHIGKVKFQMRSDDSNVDNILFWRDNQDNNVIVIESDSGDLHLTYKSIGIAEDPDYEIGAEANVELQFEGPRPV